MGTASPPSMQGSLKIETKGNFGSSFKDGFFSIEGTKLCHFDNATKRKQVSSLVVLDGNGREICSWTDLGPNAKADGWLGFQLAPPQGKPWTLYTQNAGSLAAWRSHLTPHRHKEEMEKLSDEERQLAAVRIQASIRGRQTRNSISKPQRHFGPLSGGRRGGGANWATCEDALRTIPADKIDEYVDTMYTLLQNLRNPAHDLKHRKIRRAYKLCKYPGAQDLLTLIGFEELEDFPEHYVLGL